jgi:hypothetical protein
MKDFTWLALLAALGSSAAPAFAAQFVPPAGWTQNPVLAQQPAPRIWLPSSGTNSTIAALVLPMPNPLAFADMMHSGNPAGTTVSVDTATACGSPARIVHLAGTVPAEIVLERSGGTSYAVAYMWAPSTPEDGGALRFVTHFCPSSVDAIDTLGAPPGWSGEPALHVVNAWSDPSMEQSLMLFSGAPMSLLALTQTMLAPMTTIGGVVLANKPAFALCGHPANEAVATLSIPGILSLELDAIATQSATASYLLLYQTASPDPAVLATMHGFCPS